VNAINIIVLLFVLPAAAAANECFCLENKDDHFRHSCEMQQQGYQQVIHCLDDQGNPSYTFSNLSGWNKLADGEGRCNPCRQSVNLTRGGDIRGKDNLAA
jgi:hypothetical protein